MAIVERELRGRRKAFWIIFPFKGRSVWEHAGNNRRAAETLEAQRKREVADGTYSPKLGTSRASTVAKFAEAWLGKRKNRNAENDERALRRHVLSIDWFAKMRIDLVGPHEIAQVVEALQKTALAPKTIANIYGLLRTMFRSAVVARLVYPDPCVLEYKALDRERQREPEVYTLDEIRTLITDRRAGVEKRIFAAVAFFTGAREGEICGLRWSDWDRDSLPLGCLTVAGQYEGRVTKTKKKRKVPVHADLAMVLDAWWLSGFELFHCRKPTPTDHIVPPRASHMNRYGDRDHHTKSSAYKMWIALCKAVGVTNKSLHSTRHSMITWARRGGADPDVLQKITHNAKGTILDQYTHVAWEPLCNAVSCLAFFDSHQRLHPSGGTPKKASGRESPVDHANTLESHMLPNTVPSSIPGASTENQGLFGPKSKSESKSTPCNSTLRGRLLTPARLLHEAKEIALGERVVERPEAAVRARLKRVAKTLPAFASVKRRTGGTS
jgi:integrase